MTSRQSSGLAVLTADIIGDLANWITHHPGHTAVEIHETSGLYNPFSAHVVVRGDLRNAHRAGRVVRGPGRPARWYPNKNAHPRNATPRKDTP